MGVQDLAFFTMRDGGVFHGNDPARGPWSEDGCHAGPAIGLIARAVEALLPAQALTRLTVDLIRPIPMDGFTIDAEPTRQGRTVGAASAHLMDRDGTVCARASSLHVTERDLGEVATIDVPVPSPSVATSGRFPVTGTSHNQPSFGDFVDVAYPPGETSAPGPTTIWMRIPPILSSENPSPFQRLCPLADCGNGTSRNTEITEMGFMNGDITIVAHRHPQSEWLALEAVSHWQPTGIGLAEARILDEQGPVASVLQTVILMPVA